MLDDIMVSQLSCNIKACETVKSGLEEKCITTRLDQMIHNFMVPLLTCYM